MGPSDQIDAGGAERAADGLSERTARSTFGATVPNRINWRGHEKLENARVPDSAR